MKKSADFLDGAKSVWDATGGTLINAGRALTTSSVDSAGRQELDGHVTRHTNQIAQEQLKNILIAGLGLGAATRGGVGMYNMLRRNADDGPKADPRMITLPYPQALDRRPKGQNPNILPFKVAQQIAEKLAIIIPSWGGQHITLSPQKSPVGLTAGYSHAFGVLPLPQVGVRVGTENGGMSLTGPIPGIGVDNGMTPNRWERDTFPRSFWGWLNDKMNNRPDPYKQPLKYHLAKRHPELHDEVYGKDEKPTQKKEQEKPKARKQPPQAKAATEDPGFWDTLKAKVTGSPPASPMETSWFPLAATLGGIGAVAAGYKGTDMALDIMRRKQREAELAKAKDEFRSALVGQYQLKAALDRMFAKLTDLVEKRAFAIPAEKLADAGGIPGVIVGGYGAYSGLSALLAGMAGYDMATKRSKRQLLDRAVAERDRQRMAERPTPIYAIPQPMPRPGETPDSVEDLSRIAEAA